MATTKQTYEIIKVLSELSKQGPFSIEQGLSSLKDVIKINSPFASKKAKEIWSKSDKNLELLWECCQIPDFEKKAYGQHINVIDKVFQFLSTRKKKNSEFFYERTT